LFCASELFVRVYYDGKFSTRPSYRVADEQCEWKLAPNLDHTFWGEGWSMHLRTDADGYRLGALGRVPEDADLIVLSGDSVTFGWGVSTHETMASVLDRLIHEASGGRMRVVNLGVPGYSTFQCVRRLEQFLRRHPDARLRALLFNHSSNDRMGNASSSVLRCVLGYSRLLGSDPVTRNPSSSHLVNLVLYRAEPSSASDLQNAGDMVARWAREDPPDPFFIGESEFTSAEFANAASNTEVRSVLLIRLMKEAVESLHRAVAGRRITVYHTFLYGDLEPFQLEVSGIVAEASSGGNDIRDLGCVPSPGSFSGQILNRHKGFHFSPEMNRRWAEDLLKLLQDNKELGLR
jgi:lysophospholipase L1-like esterase